MKRVLLVLLVLVATVFGQGTRPPPNSIVAILGAPASRGISTTTYFSLRTDTLPGSGTAEDPFNAGGTSTAAKAVAFDTKARTLPNNAHIVLLGGPTAVFWTNGQPTNEILGFDVKEGWWISGGGATLKLASTNSGVVIGSRIASVHHVLIEDLVIDANWAGLLNNTTTNADLAYINLAGSHNLVRNVHGFNAYGHTSECFAMLLTSGNSSSVEVGTDNYFVDCTAESPHGDYVDAFCFFGVNEDQAPGHHFPITHSGAIRCRSMGAWNQGFASAWANDITFSECKALGTTFGYYDDTGFNDEIHIDNCYFDTVDRTLMWNTGGNSWSNDHLFVTNNTIHSVSAGISLYFGKHDGVVITNNKIYAGHVSGAQDGVDIYVGAGEPVKNVKIAENTFYTGDFGCTISQAVSNITIENNNFYDGLVQAVQLATMGGGLTQGINQVIENNTITTHYYGITSQDAVPTGVTIKGNHITGIGGSSTGIYFNGSGGHLVTDNVIDTITPFATLGAANFTQRNHTSAGAVIGTPTAVSIVEGGTGNVSSFVQTTSGTFTVPSGTRLVRSSNTSTVTFNLPVIGSSHPTGMDILARNEASGGSGVVIKDSSGSMVTTITQQTAARLVPLVAPSTWVSIPSSSAFPIYNGANSGLSANTVIIPQNGKSFKLQTGPGTGIFEASTDGSFNGQLAFFGAALHLKPTGNVSSALSSLGLVGSPTIAFADVTGLGTAAALATGTSAGNIPVLDGSGKIPTSELPASSTTFKGVWNANTNSPTITSSSGTLGWFYLVNTAGTSTVDGISSWAVGDQIIFDGSVWKQVSAASLVTSVNTRTGAVTTQEADITDATALGRNIGKITTLNALSLLRLNADNSVTARSYADFKIDTALDQVENTLDSDKNVNSATTLIFPGQDGSISIESNNHVVFDAVTAYEFTTGQAALFRTGLGLGTMALQANTSTSTAIQKGNGTGGFTPAAASTDYIAATSGSSIQKASSGGLVGAVAGTDYIAATSGSAIQKASGGGLAAAVTGTDFVGVPVVTTVAFGSTVTPAVGTTGNTTTYVIGALTNNIIIGAPTGTPVDGQILKFRFVQDGTGSHSVTWNSAFVFGTDITAAMEPMTASAIWRRAFEWNAATSKWECTGLVRGF